MPSVNLIFLLDVSGTMEKYGRIYQLNTAVPAIMTDLNRVILNQGYNVSVRVIDFSDEAHYLFGSSAEKGVTPKEVLSNWKPMTVVRTTQTYKAINLAIDAMHTENLIVDGSMDNIICAPVVILLTDGQTSDHDRYMEAINKIKGTRKRKSGREGILRVAIGVNDAVEAELNEFASVWPTVVRDENGNERIEDRKQVYRIDDNIDITGTMTKLVISSVISTSSVDLDGNATIPIDPTGDSTPTVESGLSTDFSDFS